MPNQVIVTGGAGFIGSNIVAELNRRGIKDALVVDRPDSEAKKKHLEDLSYARLIDQDDFRAVFNSAGLEDAKAVIHMGACSSTTETNEKYMMDNNYIYTRELCEKCLEEGVRFIYASSAATYGDGSLGYSDDDSLTPSLKPLNIYAKSKQMFDLWALEKGHLNRIAGLKYFNVYGPREDHKGDMRSVVNKAFHQIRETGAVTLFKSHKPEYGHGEQERDFVFVKDAVKATLFFLDNPGISGLFNCGTGTARTWLDLANAVFAAMQLEPEIRFADMPEAIRDKYQYHTCADMTKLRQTGYADTFTSLEQGVSDYVRNYLTQELN